MQAIWFIQLVGWILLVGGIILIAIALLSALSKSDSDEEQSTKSKGLILIGPIPIVWGYGKRGWLFAGTLGAVILIIWILLFL
jgi:uncharacterized protein (TIGR00304 family)